MRIYAQNPILTDNPSTNMSASSLTGAVTLALYNNAGFSSTTNLLLLSTYADQQAEIVKTSATTTTSATLSTGTLFPHAQDTTVTLMPYDQVEFSRSDDGGNTWTVLTLTNIQVDRNATVYVDNNGQSTSVWRFRFYNSLASVYSGYSNSISSSGYYAYQLESLQNRVISLFPDPNMQFLAFSDVTDWVNECAENMAGEIYMAGKMGLNATVNETFSNSNIITLPNDFVYLVKLWISYDNVNYYSASEVALNRSLYTGLQSSSQQQFNQTAPVYTKEDDKLYIYPNTSNPISYQLIYYRLPTVLVNPGDSLDLIFRPFTGMFIDYCMYRAKQKDKNKDSLTYWTTFNQKKVAFMEQMSKWQLSEPDTIDEDDFDNIMGSPRFPGRL